MSAQVVILSSIEWDAAWQRHQIFAAQWAGSGTEVFFVENSGLRNPGVGDLPRLWRRALRLIARLPRAHPPPRHLHVVSPLVLPPTASAFRQLNRALFLPRLAAQLRALGLRPGATVICYLPTTTTLDLLGELSPGLIVYDCVDNLHGLPWRPADLPRLERELLRRSDVVLTTSSTLYEERAVQHPRVRRLHHGVSESFFIGGRRRSGPHRRLCYFGTLWHAIDYAALAALARAGFEVTLLGPQKEPLPRLPAGVLHRAAVAHARLPHILAEFDALLLPYVANDYNRGVIPAKIYECLATGLPVLASPLPALRELAPQLYVAKTPEDWVRQARALDENETAPRRAERVAIARGHLQETQFARLQQELSHASRERRAASAELADRSGAPLSELLRGLSWIGALYGLAKAATLFSQMLAGRLLGPAQYGKAHVVIALAAYLQVLPMLGFPLALSKFVAGERDEAARRRLISSAFALFAFWAALWAGLLALAAAPLARALGLEAALVRLAAGLAVCTAVYVVLSSPLLGLKRFDRRGAAEAFYGLSTPALLLILTLGWEPSYRAMVLASCASLLGGTCFALWSLRGWLRPAFDWKLLRPIAPYAAVAAANFLAAACVTAPGRLLLNRYFTAQEVGIYSAYFTATAQVSLALLYMLQSVLVPLAGTPDGQASLWRASRGLRPQLLAAGAGFFLVTAVAALSLFGRQYPLRWDWAALFAGAGSLVLAHGTLGALFAARDFAGLCIAVAGHLLVGLTNAGLGLWLVPSHGISGAAFALLGAYLLGFTFYLGCEPRARRGAR